MAESATIETCNEPIERKKREEEGKRARKRASSEKNSFADFLPTSSLSLSLSLLTFLPPWPYLWNGSRKQLI